MPNQVVLTMCEQDGGVHVDSFVEEKYVALQNEDMGYKVSLNGAGYHVIENDIAMALVRQIGWEVLCTLERYFLSLDQN